MIMSCTKPEISGWGYKWQDNNYNSFEITLQLNHTEIFTSKNTVCQRVYRFALGLPQIASVRQVLMILFNTLFHLFHFIMALCPFTFECSAFLSVLLASYLSHNDAE